MSVYLDHAGKIETRSDRWGKYITPDLFGSDSGEIAEIGIFNPYYYNKAKHLMKYWPKDVDSEMSENRVFWGEEIGDNSIILNTEFCHSMNSLRCDYFGDFAGKVQSEVYGHHKRLNARNLNTIPVTTTKGKFTPSLEAVLESPQGGRIRTQKMTFRIFDDYDNEWIRLGVGESDYHNRIYLGVY